MAHFQVCAIHTILGPLLEIETCKKCTALCCEAHVQVKTHENTKTSNPRTTFESSEVVSAGRYKGLCALSRLSKTSGICNTFKTMASVELLKRACKEACCAASACAALRAHFWGCGPAHSLGPESGPCFGAKKQKQELFNTGSKCATAPQADSSTCP